MKSKTIRYMIGTFAAAALAAVSASAAYAVSVSDAVSLKTGTAREAVHDSLGEPSEESFRKEVYELDDNARAIAHYDNDLLVGGYILN